MSYKLKIPTGSKMDVNLEEQWIIDEPHAGGISEWVAWLYFLLDGVECNIEYKRIPTHTCIDFSREEDLTFFILRWS